MTTTAPYRVRVIVDPAFGERLVALPAHEPVWIIDSPVNTPVVHKLWRDRSVADHLTGITTFSRVAIRPEDDLLAHLDTIELHHGNFSADPPYSIIEVIGCSASGRVQSALREFGFAIDSTTSEGFIATIHVA